jgi:hypothetical protein
MGELSEADLVWNRACDVDFEPRLPGDHALWDVIHLDSDINNGGLDHAIDCVGPPAFVAAAAGFRYFGIEEVAEIVERANAIAERVMKDGVVDILDLTAAELAEIEELETRYFDTLGSELPKTYEAYRTAHPEDFEALDQEWVRAHDARAAELEASWRTQRDPLAAELAEHLRGLGDVE